MIVLFINLHKDDQEGKIKFEKYYKDITKVLKQSIYYGSQYEEEIRRKDNIGDFLYDNYERRQQEKAKQKFKSVTYIFIDGPLNTPPWISSLNDICLLIRNSLKENKKIHFNGFGHIAAYFCLSTGFDKPYFIRKKGENINGRVDYFHDEETGNLQADGKKICSSGVYIIRNSKRYFQTKSMQALNKGTILPTKFHYLAFNSKNGESLIKDIRFPFTFFQKHKVFCVPIINTRAPIVPIIETQDRIPIAFLHRNSLSTHLLCPQMLTLFSNWILNGLQVKPDREVALHLNYLPDTAVDNFIGLKSCKTTVNLSQADTLVQGNRKTNVIIRPQTACTSTTKSKFTFDKPSVRCSGPYETSQQIRTKQQLINRGKLFGRTRMFFKSEMSKNQIQNYVQRTPSRPPTAHVFREVNKNKWVGKKNFVVV